MQWRQYSWGAWLGCLALLWALHPVLLSQARGIVLLACLSLATAWLGLLLGIPLWVVWSAGLGVLNLTLALLVSGHPTDLWLGLSAGVVLLGLLDGQYSLLAMRQAQVEPGVLTVFLKAFLHLSGWSLLIGLALGLLVLQLASQRLPARAAGYLTIVGAGLFVGFFAAFLVLTGRWTGLQTPDDEAERYD
ncbi:MAG: hypothetical protein AB7N91_04400 [Candidatus Tectimicrobiota bacterium]